MCEDEQLLAVLNLELAKNTCEMVTDRDVANGEPVGNIFVFQSMPQ
jgi:hypothetical protein